jgi:hypothetical protein
MHGVKRFFVLFLFLFITDCNIDLVFKDAPKVENGILNLTFWDFEKQGAINLEGKWEIYWKKLIRPTDENSFSEVSPSEYFDFPDSWKGRKAGK